MLVTAGGGGDGYVLMDNYLSMIEQEAKLPPFKSIMVTGPFMPRDERNAVARRARRLGVRVLHFYPRMEEMLAASDVVVGMGGYNTICEILSVGTPTLTIPRDTPRLEQLIRARVLNKKGLVEYISWSEFTPERLRERVYHLLENPAPYREAMGRFSLTGLDIMAQRVKSYREKEC